MTTIRKRVWTNAQGETKTAWQVDYRDNLNRRRSKQFERKKQAETFLTTASWEVSQGIHTPDSASITVSKAAKLWIARGEADELERSTLKEYRSLVTNHIEPLIGDRKLNKLKRLSVENYRDELSKTRSSAMVKKSLVALSSILTEAQRLELVVVNAARGVKVGRSKERKDTKGAGQVVIPGRDELKAMIAAANDRERPLIMTAIFTGLRVSELRGLRWTDIDFDAGTLSVSQRADTFGQIGPPKSQAGIRSVPIPSMLIAELKRWKLQAPLSKLDLAFPSAVGTPFGYQNLLRRVFFPLQDRAGLETRYGFHALRHAAASTWIEQKIDLKRLQVWMGHSSIKITLDTYGHLIKDADKDAAIAEATQDLLLG